MSSFFPSATATTSATTSSTTFPPSFLSQRFLRLRPNGRGPDVQRMVSAGSDACASNPFSPSLDPRIGVTVIGNLLPITLMRNWIVACPVNRLLLFAFLSVLLLVGSPSFHLLSLFLLSKFKCLGPELLFFCPLSPLFHRKAKKWK